MRALLLPALLTLALSGCVPGFEGLGIGGGGGAGPADDGLTRQVTAPGSGIVLAGPPGYCLDQTASGLGEPAAFAAFRRCEVLRGDSFPLARRALLTVSISADGADAPVVTGSEQRLLDFFGTDAGKRALSRSGDASTVTVMQSYSDAGAVWLQVSDTSPAQQLDPAYWRALFDLKGRIVTVTVASYADGPMRANRAKSLVQEFVTLLRSLNAPGEATRGAGAPASGPGLLRAVPLK